jgi:hypothetical protein
MVTSPGPGFTKLQGIVPAVVYAYFLFSWVTDRGIVPWLEYEQMALTGSYSPFMSPLLQSITAAPVCAVVVAMGVGAVEAAWSRLHVGGGAGPSSQSADAVRPGEDRPSRSSDERSSATVDDPLHPASGATFQFRKSPALVPLPPVGNAAYRRSAHAGPAKRFPAVCLICAVAFTATAWVSIRSIIKATNTPDTHRHEVIDISQEISPHASHVELIAVGHPGMAVVVTQDGGKSGPDNCRTFTPLLPPNWNPGMPVKYFEEGETTFGGCGADGEFTHDVDLTVGRYDGRLAHMSGVALYGFTGHGVLVDGHPVALKSDSDTELADIVFPLSLIGALTFSILFLIFLVEYLRAGQSAERSS